MKSLLISPTPPWPANRGGNQRTGLIFKALKALGDVDLLLICGPDALTSEQITVLSDSYGLINRFPLMERGAKGHWGPLWRVNRTIANSMAHHLGDHSVHYEPDPLTAKWLNQRISETPYDVIVGRYLIQPARSGALQHHPLIIDVDDLDSQRYQSRLDAPNTKVLERVILRSHVRRFHHALRNELAKADHVWVTNQEDLSHIDHASISLLPNIPYSQTDKSINPLPQKHESNTILMVCSMNFDVNVRGIDYFLGRIWPLIRQQETNAELCLVGSGMSNENKLRWGAIAGVRPSGYVENLEDAYRDCAITVTPVFEGGGTKIKVPESLMYGRTSVITKHAHRGYETILKSEESLIVANDDTHFADACVGLLRNPCLRQRLAVTGHDKVKAHLSFDAFYNTVLDTVNAMIQGRG